jgi:phosphoribosylformylglycinamidine (FGAM) synthase-like enzyme
MVGLIEGRAPTPSAFQDEGDVVALLGDLSADPRTLNGSTYLAALHGTVAGAPPLLDLDAERVLQEVTLAAITGGHIRSAHDCSDGGLAVALAECCMWSGLGFTSDDEVGWPATSERLAAAALLFGEAPSRIVVSLPAAAWGALAALAGAARVPLTRLGTVGGTHLRVAGLLDCPVDELHAAWHNGLAEALRGGVANVTVGVGEDNGHATA